MLEKYRWGNQALNREEENNDVTQSMRSNTDGTAVHTEKGENFVIFVKSWSVAQ